MSPVSESPGVLEYLATYVQIAVERFRLAIMDNNQPELYTCSRHWL